MYCSPLILAPSPVAALLDHHIVEKIRVQQLDFHLIHNVAAGISEKPKASPKLKRMPDYCTPYFTC
jgi:hypothetical protein